MTLVTAAAPALSDDLPLPLLLSQVLPVASGMDRKEAGRRGTSAAVSVGLVLRRLYVRHKAMICFQKSSEPKRAPG